MKLRTGHASLVCWFHVSSWAAVEYHPANFLCEAFLAVESGGNKFSEGKVLLSLSKNQDSSQAFERSPVNAEKIQQHRNPASNASPRFMMLDSGTAPNGREVASILPCCCRWCLWILARLLLLLLDVLAVTVVAAVIVFVFVVVVSTVVVAVVAVAVAADAIVSLRYRDW